LKVRLRSRFADGRPLGFGHGATVVARVGGVSLRRTLDSVSYLSQSSQTLHFGLGGAAQADSLEVRWPAGTTQTYPRLDADATYEIVEDDPTPRKLPSTAPPGNPPRSADRTNAHKPSPPDRARLVEFWKNQRAAMNAMKVERDFAAAIRLFQEALALDPAHEDSRYYLAHCLAAVGDADGATAQLEELQRLNPQSHRAFQQWGCLRAAFARSDSDLAAAERALQRACALNPEETGALLVLGEIALLRGRLDECEQRLSAACRSNPKAVGGFFLRGYLAWKRGDAAQAEQLLRETRQALGKDWQPKGATSEGDVRRKQYVETSPLAPCWQRWDGRIEPAAAYAALEARLAAQTRRAAE
jgi:tetratricopeptide (TPR) repeat protein